MTSPHYYKVFLKCHPNKPMSKDGLSRWNIRLRSMVSKTTKGAISTPEQFKSPNGVSVTYLKDNETLGRFIIDNWCIDNGLYSFRIFVGKKKNNRFGLWLELFKIEIYDTENYKFRINEIVKSKKGKKINRINRMWFRKSRK